MSVSVSVSGVIRATRNAALVVSLVVIDQVIVNTQAIAAIPGDLWGHRCERNAKRCLHSVKADSDTGAICCAEMADLLDGLPTAA